ncbi:MAG: M48 family metallopeptidase [Rhodobacteraceae bacterium]|jgi:predicted metal-dependent hydrolase|nr:M48 family metallopeptidase [Paracoccaceae bacterium]
MTAWIEVPGAPGIPVRLRRHRQARRLTLRVSRVDGTVTLTLPTSCGTAEARRFLADRAGWLRRVRAELPARAPVVPGAVLPLRDVPLRIAADAGRGVRVTGGRLAVGGPADRVAARLRAFLIHEARADAARATARHAARLGRPAPPVRLADTRSRWGSCTADGRLMLSWRLVMAPPLVLDYVAAHEAAHLVHMDHSPAFWATVGALFPDHAAARQWLKARGADLLRYDFRG